MTPSLVQLISDPWVQNLSKIRKEQLLQQRLDRCKWLIYIWLTTSWVLGMLWPRMAQCVRGVAHLEAGPSHLAIGSAQLPVLHITATSTSLNTDAEGTY